MSFSSIFWDQDDDPLGNVQHIAEHDLTIEDVEEVLASPASEEHSNSSGLPAAWGHVPDGRFIIVVYEQIDQDTIRVTTYTKFPSQAQNGKEGENSMAKPTFKRIRRTEKVSAEQAARDEEIRRKVKVEFPPLEAELSSAVLSDPLKEAIARSSKSPTELANAANVSPIVLTQFLAGQRDLRLATAEKLAHVLGLKLVAS